MCAAFRILSSPNIYAPDEGKGANMVDGVGEPFRLIGARSEMGLLH